MQPHLPPDAPPPPPSPICRFGPFRLDPDRGELRRDGELVLLPRKAFELLRLVVEREGRLISKEELFARLWPNLIVEESNLTQTVYVLRKALGEVPGHPSLLLTVAGRGYRFGAAVEWLEPPPSASLAGAQRPRSVAAATGAEAGTGDGPAVAPSPFASVPAAAWSPPAAAAAPGADRSGLPGSPRRRRSVLLACVLVTAGAAGLAVLRFVTRSEAPPPTAISIAVLPFLPLAGAAGDQALGAGMADTLITRLSRLPQLRVSSAGLRRFDARSDPLAAGRELGVDVVLEGGIQGGGDRVRVTARLLRVRDGETLWADKLDERYSDIFAVQDRLSERLATALLAQIAPVHGASDRRGAAQARENPAAHELYLQGRYHLAQGSREALELARQRFATAIARYPRYALAHVGLAETYYMMAATGPLQGRAALARSRAEAEAALALDDSLAFAHLADGAAAIGLCDWPRAEARLQRALELEPENWEIHEIWGQYLSTVGRDAEAIAAVRRAAQLNPSWLRGAVSVAVATLWARQYDAVIGSLRSALEVAPGDHVLRLLLAQAQIDRGEPAEAERLLTALAAAAPQLHPARVELARARALQGRRQEAIEAIGELQSHAADWNGLHFAVAKIYASLGEDEAAFAWLDRAYEEGSLYFVYHLRLPAFDHLRRDPRFHELERRVHLRPATAVPRG